MHRRIADGDGVAYYIDGIGPPLQQIATDHRTREEQASRDIISLIEHIDTLRAERDALKLALIERDGLALMWGIVPRDAFRRENER